MFSSMFSGGTTPEVAPGDYYDYEFSHETNDSDFLSEFLFLTQFALRWREVWNVKLLNSVCFAFTFEIGEYQN